MVSAELALLILKILGMIIAGIELAPELRRRKEAYVAKIEAMVREGRGPTDAEIEALLQESDDLTLAIRAQRLAHG